MKKIGGRCDLCDKPHETGFHFHHKFYGPESDYPRHSKSMYVRLKRLNEIETFPERFGLLCGRCHLVIESFKKATEYLPLEKIIQYVNSYNVSCRRASEDEKSSITPR